MINVATWPGKPPAAATASAVSAATAFAERTLRIHPETGRASETISEARGASAPACQVAWSPIKFTTGDRARRALCRFAIPLAKPGPRWSSVRAGLPLIRAYPSAAPVQTPSNSPSTARMPSQASSAATSGISVVPGFAKQTSTPAAAAVRIRLSAPFMTASLKNSSTGSRGQTGSCAFYDSSGKELRIRLQMQTGWIGENEVAIVFIRKQPFVHQLVAFEEHCFDIGDVPVADIGAEDRL